MKWDAFTALQQVLILLTIASQVYIALRLINKVEGAEKYVRIMAFCSGLLLFLLSRPLKLTFADLLLFAHSQYSVLNMVIIGGLIPFLVGIFLSEATIIALRIGYPIPVRIMLVIGAFTISQVAYTNFIALSTRVTTLDKAFIPNLCYAIAVGVWLTFRYRDIQPDPAIR